MNVTKSFVLLSSLLIFFSFALLPAIPATSQKEKSAEEYCVSANVVQSPELKKGISLGKPVKISLKDFLDVNKEYEVWIETSNCCRPLGKIDLKDAKMVFVVKREEPELWGTITLPEIPENAKPESSKEDQEALDKMDSGKRIYNNWDKDIFIPAGYDLRVHPYIHDKVVLVPNAYFKEKEKKEPKAVPETAKKNEGPTFYSTAPFYKRTLPDGRLEFKFVTPEGATITEVIPPQPAGTKFVGEIQK